jgi:glyoxylase-like metal-dependent hydrolase (beta-lactamase superfamily II)
MISISGPTRNCSGRVWICQPKLPARIFYRYVSGSYFSPMDKSFCLAYRPLSTPGHTKEHACFIVTSGNQSMCLTGDLSHHPVLLLERLRSQFIYDLDPLQAAETRVRVLGMLSRERRTLYGGHFPWRGIGYVAKEKDGFRYFPEATRWFQVIEDKQARSLLSKGRRLVYPGTLGAGSTSEELQQLVEVCYR